ncbi:MAG: Glycosyl transferase, group 1 family protein [Microgenomates group bacterium Gr01-1014_16]|nr:MAG: Glycosyl transferase, group 1 family protein [Microgenomates group bacterium Gr01-1014_16]
MAQRKAIFIGRTTPDTGLDAYQLIAQKHKIKLDIFTDTPNADQFISNYNYAFVSRYLVIIEALAAGVPILAHYNNQIKFDYLNQAPFRPYINIFSDPNTASLDFSKINMVKAKKWAKDQTWRRLAAQYEALWQK